jgi:RNA 2',3'-cyclic 3'-phosphodiesterase
MAHDRAVGPEAKPIRLFIAVEVPDAVKTKLAGEVARFRQRVPQARWTRSDGWHVTLKFLGMTWPRLVDTVSAAVTAVAAEASPFPSAVTELGVFPSPGRTRVIWAGLSDPEERFGALAGRLDELLVEEFDAEQRPLTPHLTLARLNPPRDIREFAPDLVGASVASEPFEVDHLVLYQSRLSPKGATYQPLLEAPLSG